MFVRTIRIILVYLVPLAVYAGVQSSSGLAASSKRASLGPATDGGTQSRAPEGTTELSVSTHQARTASLERRVEQLQRELADLRRSLPKAIVGIHRRATAGERIGREMMENTSPSPYQYGPARRRRMPLSMPKATSQQNRATEPGQELSEAGQPLRGVGQKRPAARNEPSPDGLSPTREDTPPSVEESGLERAFQDEPSASDADSTRAAHGTGEGQRHGDARQRVRYLVPVGSAQRIALVLNLLSWGIDVDQRGDELTVTGSPAAHDAVRSVIRLWEEQDETKD